MSQTSPDKFRATPTRTGRWKTEGELPDWVPPYEDLHPDLEEYLVETSFGLCLKHPLIFDIPYIDALNGRLNEGYRQKREALAQAEAEGRWSTYVFLHERPYRNRAFLDIVTHLTPTRYWPLLRRIFTDSENLHQWEGLLPLFMLGPNRPGMREARPLFMHADERKALRAMSDTLVIYRGIAQGLNEMGWSWTLDYDKATWFARRFQSADRIPVVLTGSVSRTDVVGYLTSRGEEEIAVDPEHVTLISTERL